MITPEQTQTRLAELHTKLGDHIANLGDMQPWDNRLMFEQLHDEIGALLHTINRTCKACGVPSNTDLCTVHDGPDDQPEEWLIWSHEVGAWWGPHCSRYVQYVLDAGRYTRDKALEGCGLRSWRNDRTPPEVAVLAPSPETIMIVKDMHATMKARIDAATQQAVQDRQAARAAGDTR